MKLFALYFLVDDFPIILTTFLGVIASSDIVVGPSKKFEDNNNIYLLKCDIILQIQIRDKLYAINSETQKSPFIFKHFQRCCELHISFRQSIPYQSCIETKR